MSLFPLDGREKPAKAKPGSKDSREQ